MFENRIKNLNDESEETLNFKREFLLKINANNYKYVNIIFYNYRYMKLLKSK